MGILKLILNANNAEGIREAMRIAYRKHRRQAERGALPSEFGPHIVGLLGALGTRMAANNLPVTPVALWHDLAPFTLIGDEEVAVEALAEYAVYVERTVDTKLAGLRETLNTWLRRATIEGDALKLLTNPYAQDCRWQALLENDVRGRLAQLRLSRDEPAANPLAAMPHEAALGDSTDLLQQVVWGASPSQVRALVAGCTELPPHPTQNALGFVVDMFGMPVFAVFYFRRVLLHDKLSRVVVSVFQERPPDDVVEGVYAKIRAAIEVQFGRPSDRWEVDSLSPVEFRQSETLVWIDERSVLTLSMALLRDGVSPTAVPIGICFGDIHNDPTSQSIAAAR